MGFEVAPEPVARRRSLVSGIAVAVAAAALIGFGILSSGGHTRSPMPVAEASASPVAEASASPTATQPTPTPDYQRATEDGPPLLTADPTVVCNDAGQARCRQIAVAALEIAGASGQTVAKVDVWTSLMCRDAFDCPVARLATTRPFGSAVVSFGPGHPDAWIDVVELDHGKATGTNPVLAWIIRSGD